MKPSTERTDERQLHIHMLMQLYSETRLYRKAGYVFAALQIMKEVAKLKAIYPTRDEFRTDEKVTITLNLGDDLKTGKPEKEQLP